MHEEDAGILWCVPRPFSCAEIGLTLDVAFYTWSQSKESSVYIRHIDAEQRSVEQIRVDGACSPLANVTSHTLAHSIVWEHICHGHISNE